MATYLVSQGSGIAVKGGRVKDAAWGSSRVWAHTLLKYEKAQKRMKQSLVFQQFWQELGAMTTGHVSKGGQKPNLRGSRPPFSMMLHCLMVKSDELVDLSRDAQDRQWAGKRCHCYCCCHSIYYLVTVFITITVMLVGIIVILILNIDTFSCIRPLFWLYLFALSQPLLNTRAEKGLSQIKQTNLFRSVFMQLDSSCMFRLEPVLCRLLWSLWLRINPHALCFSKKISITGSHFM